VRKEVQAALKVLTHTFKEVEKDAIIRCITSVREIHEQQRILAQNMRDKADKERISTKLDAIGLVLFELNHLLDRVVSDED